MYSPHIAPSTLMIHRSLVARGWTFDGNLHLQVVGIVARHRLAGIPERHGCAGIGRRFR
jgi:hypothetical protein